MAAAGYQVVATGLTQDEVDAIPSTDGVCARVLDVTDSQSVTHLLDGLDRLDAATG